MKKFCFVSLIGVLSLAAFSAFAQNYYDQNFYQNQSPNYAGYATPRYNYQPAYAQQNYGYYAQQYRPAEQVIKENGQPKVETKRRGVGTLSVGADYVLGYASFLNADYSLEEIIAGGNEFTFDTRDFDKNIQGLSVNLGWRPFTYIGIEAFYLMSLDSNKKENVLSNTYFPEFATSEFDVAYKAYGVDIVGYYPINDYIELLASIGVGKYDVEADVTVSARDVGVSPNVLRSVTKTFEDSVQAYRIGGGVQIWLSKYLAFRLTGRWTQLGGDFVDYITEVNAGVRYHF